MHGGMICRLQGGKEGTKEEKEEGFRSIKWGEKERGGRVRLRLKPVGKNDQLEN